MPWSSCQPTHTFRPLAWMTPGCDFRAPCDRLHPRERAKHRGAVGGGRVVSPARGGNRPSTWARAGKPSTEEARLPSSGSARRHAVEMTARRRLPMALRDASFRVRDALHRGVSRGRLDARDLVRPFHGIRSAFPPESVDERARALAPRLRPDQVFSHVTAAAIIGVPLPRRLERDQRLHVTTIGTDQALRVRGTVGHRARYGSVRATIARGVPLTTPADTFVALGSMLTLDELIIAGDALVGWLGWATLDELAQAVRRRRGIRGIVKLRLALDEIRRGSRSPGETRTRLALVRRGLPEPALNHDVVVNGQWVACVDLAYPEARVAIEYESDLHRTDPATFRKDLTRGEHLKDVDWWLVRATADDVAHGVDRFVHRIRRLLEVGVRGAHDTRFATLG